MPRAAVRMCTWGDRGAPWRRWSPAQKGGWPPSCRRRSSWRSCQPSTMPLRQRRATDAPEMADVPTQALRKETAVRTGRGCTAILALAVGCPRRARGVLVGAIGHSRSAGGHNRAQPARAQLQHGAAGRPTSSPRHAAELCMHRAIAIARACEEGRVTSVVTGLPIDEHIDSRTGKPLEPCRGQRIECAKHAHSQRAPH